MGNPDHRPGLRIRILQPHREGPDRMSDAGPAGHLTATQEEDHSMQVKKIALALLAAALIAPASAQAHISLHPNTIPAGAFATLDVRVPGEQEDAYVTRVDMLFPAGFTGVDYENVPGWNAHIIETRLPTPIQIDGETINTEVSQIVWSWAGPLGRVN